MDQLLCHLCGDYLLQNHWMALFKKKKLWVAFMHAMVYTLPFCLISRHPTALLTICVTHAFMDRYSLVNYWCRFYGVGCPGWIYLKMHGLPLEENQNSKAPAHLYDWLMILADNTCHLAINYGCLTLCPYLHWSTS